jgi:hypothetical protein
LAGDPTVEILIVREAADDIAVVLSSGGRPAEKRLGDC